MEITVTEKIGSAAVDLGGDPPILPSGLRFRCVDKTEKIW